MKYLGLDWGLKRIGLAISEGEFASPFKIVEIKNLKDGVRKIAELVKKENMDAVIIGQPEGGMGRVVQKVIKQLSNLGMKVVAADETLSTQEAKRVMIEIGISKKDRKEDNALSAAIILQRWLDEKP